MAATQRPISALGFSQRTRSPAWRSLPSWAVIPTGDKAAGTDVLRRMAARAGATITEADLDKKVKTFGGREMTQRQVLMLIVTHMHEHLGQSIAYARMNGITPPWSEGG